MVIAAARTMTRTAAMICAAAAVAGLVGCGGRSPTGSGGPSPTTLAGGGGTGTSSSFYLALGDSLAAGVQPAPPGAGPRPTRIKAGAIPTEGYANDVYEAEKTRLSGLMLQDLGCPGETTMTMMAGGKCPYAAGSQLAQAVSFIRAHRIAFITLDIGGDDIDGCVTTATIISTCVTNGVDAIKANVPKILSALRTAAGPSVQIVAMTYYDPYLADFLSGADGPALAVASVELTRQVNDTLISIFRATNVGIGDVGTAFGTYTPFTRTTTYAGHTVPVAVANICDWTWMCAGAPIGPNVHANTSG